ncbi:MAG: glycosyltransferase family 2 protein [Nitrospinota bacterium]
MRLSVVIVNYNTGGYLGACLASITQKFSGTEYEVIVVDNASSDGSADAAGGIPRTRLIKSGDNIGFGRACNLGARETTGKNILFLNPDTKILSNNIEALLDGFEADEKVSALGCRNRLPDGSMQPSAYSFPTLPQAAVFVFRLQRVLMSAPAMRLLTPFLKSRVGQYADHSERRKVDWVTGAFMLVKREQWERLEGFDEQFFLFCEEIDFCKRISQSGGEVWFEPSFEMEHYVGYSSDRVKPLVLLEKSRSYVLYFKKHHSGLKSTGLRLMLGFGVRLWMAFYSLMGDHESYESYADVKRELGL